MNQPKTDFYAFRFRNSIRSKATHAVKRINKNGSVSKAHVSDSCLFTSEEKAETRKFELERFNPGTRFIVVFLMV